MSHSPSVRQSDAVQNLKLNCRRASNAAHRRNFMLRLCLQGIAGYLSCDQEILSILSSGQCPHGEHQRCHINMYSKCALIFDQKKFAALCGAFRTTLSASSSLSPCFPLDRVVHVKLRVFKTLAPSRLTDCISMLSTAIGYALCIRTL